MLKKIRKMYNNSNENCQQKTYKKCKKNAKMYKKLQICTTKTKNMKKCSTYQKNVKKYGYAK